MTDARPLAILAACALVLTGCAVPGQGGAPGVTATYAGETVTSAHLDALAAAWEEDSDGNVIFDRRQLATLEVLGPEALVAAEAAAYPITVGDAKIFAQAWFEYVGVTDPEVSDQVAESMRDLLAIYVLSFGEDTQATLTDIAARVEDQGVFSPRVGEFTATALTESIAAAQTSATNTGLGNYSFIAYAQVSGFSPTTADWAARQ